VAGVAQQLVPDVLANVEWFRRNPMAEPDIRFRAYIRRFFKDVFARMSGPLSVPFAGLALWVSGHTQKILFGCLAVLSALYASYRVWRNERIEGNQQLEASKIAAAKNVSALVAQQTQQVALLNQRLAQSQETINALNNRVTELRRRPYTEDLRRTAQQVIDHLMTLEGRHILRQLMNREPVEVGRELIPNVSMDRQHAQLGIAMEHGIVQHQEEGALRRTYWIINPRFRPVLEDLLYESGRL
jgi:hypothetical protein